MRLNTLKPGTRPTAEEMVASFVVGNWRNIAIALIERDLSASLHQVFVSPGRRNRGKYALSTNHCLPQITRVFYVKPSSGLTRGIPGRSRRVGFWIVASDAIASNAITDARLSEGRKMNHLGLKRRRQLQVVDANAGLSTFLR
jgi:hypothetical protein